MTELERKRKYQEAFALLERAKEILTEINKALDELEQKHEQDFEWLSREAA